MESDRAPQKNDNMIFVPGVNNWVLAAAHTKIQYAETPNMKNQQFEGADFAGQDVAHLPSETKH